jgi:formate hydrogenlyase subunit 4
MAMGIATVVISTLGTVDLKTVAILLRIGMFCLGLAGLDSLNKKNKKRNLL